MKRTTYQVPEIRDENDNIIQDGTFGKHSAFSNATNDGAFDYILNNLEALHDNLNGSRIYVANKAALPATGDLSAMYIAEDTGKWYLWDGQKYIETDNARKIADEAIAARDAAKASQSAAKTSETNAKTSETNAAASKTAAATSASAAKTSENNAGTQANTAKAWATSTTSPDGAADTSSTTGKTQSAKSWAMYSKDRATASASSASAAAGSASAAKTSENNAASSKSAAATSATNAANSAKAAADSATAAANSAREQQADWNVTDSSSKAFIKNKPDVLLKSGGTATGTIIAPSFQTGNDASHYFQCRKFRGSGDADEYYHAIDFGYSGRDTVDFYEYGGVWNFYQSRRGTIETSTLVGAITASAGWDGLVKGQDITTYAKKSDLSSSVSTTSLTVSGETSVPTANAGNSSKAIANTEFVAKSLASLVNGAPAQLNTLNELAKALGNDANFSATITAELAKKLNSTEAESTYLPLSGGTINGDLSFTGGSRKINFSNGKSQVVSLGNGVYVYGDTADKQSSFVAFTNENGSGFQINAGDGTTQRRMIGKPDGTLTWDGQPLLPVGVVQAFAGTTIPNGWLLCDGSAVSRTDYAALYAVIGTTYGAGDGSTTFNLPNLTDKFIQGSARVGTVKSAGLPNIAGLVYGLGGVAGHNYPISMNEISTSNDLFQRTGGDNIVAYWDDPYVNASGRDAYAGLDFNANRLNPIYGNSTTVQPPSVTMRYIIKY